MHRRTTLAALALVATLAAGPALADTTLRVFSGGSGQRPAGGFATPTKTMFQFAPVQLPQAALRENHCCCEPEFTCPSILQSARKPPLDQPPSQRLRSPFTCTRRNAVA